MPSSNPEPTQNPAAVSEEQFMKLALEAQNRRAVSRLAVSRAMAVSSVLAKQNTAPEAVLEAIESLPNTKLHVSSGGGVLVGERGGKPVDLVKLVEEALLTNPGLADGRSTKHFEGNADVVQAKSDLTQTQASKFIAEHGLAKYEALPLKRTSEVVDLDPNKLTAKQYLSMSRQQRMAYQQRPDVNEEVLGAILRRK